MTLADVRAAALDSALIGDDPTTALALAGVVDAAEGTDDPLAVAMLAMRCVGRDAGESLDDGAWRPGDDVDDAVLAGAAVAVRRRNVSLDRAATLAGCAPTTLEAVVERQRVKRERE
ncbi:hypothetical protein [Haloplanus salilacus]|uniref:hypothetical protein n=1 Tax=Haloplanus salilacus TaxID=2949994 RepID=UPI0030D2528F